METPKGAILEHINEHSEFNSVVATRKRILVGLATLFFPVWLSVVWRLSAIL